MRWLWLMSMDPMGPANGQRTYSVGLARALATLGEEVTVVHPGPRAAEVDGPANLVWKAAGQGDRNRRLSVMSSMPAMAYVLSSAQMKQLVERCLSEGTWDVVVIDQLGSGFALDLVEPSVAPSTVVVHCSANHEGKLRGKVTSGTTRNPLVRAVLALDARKVERLEGRVVRRADLTTAITEADASSFRVHYGSIRPLVLPPGYDGARVERRTLTADIPRRVVVAGSYHWRVKQHDLLELLRVADAPIEAAGAEIIVVGDAPPEFMEQVRQTTRATRILGRVDSFAAEFAQSRLALIAEPNGGGFKLKTLDYAFHRVPMLVQTGSIEGLPLRPGSGFLEFANLPAVVEGAVEMLDDFDTLNRIQEVAYERCADRFDWSTSGAVLRDAVLDRRGSGTI